MTNITAEARRQAYITRLAKENEGLRRQVGALQSALRRVKADVDNPAQPVPDGPEESPAATTDEARAADITVELTAPGGVMAPDMAQTVDTTAPGGVATVDPAIAQDVTSPVAGGTDVPIPDVRTEVDVVTDGETIGENAATGDWVNTTARRRTFASLRLARLRVAAGIAQGDDIAMAEVIAASKMTEGEMRTEIEALTRVGQRTSRQPSRTATRAPSRAVPSLVTASMPSIGFGAPSMTPEDDEFAWI